MTHIADLVTFDHGPAESRVRMQGRNPRRRRVQWGLGTPCHAAFSIKRGPASKHLTTGVLTLGGAGDDQYLPIWPL